MFSPFMMLLGFIFSVGMIVLIEWLDNETKIKVSIFNMVMVATGTLLGGITVLLCSLLGLMMVGEDKRFKGWFNKPRITFDMPKKDKE